MGILSNFFDLFFPPKCIFCFKFLKKDEKVICTHCQNTLPYTKGSGVSQSGEFFDVCVSPFYYVNNVRNSILRFKFKGAMQLAEHYGKYLADCIKSELNGEYDIITWVPLSKTREKKRGYDQSMLLAYAVALELNDVAVETLVKNVDVKAQSSLGGKPERRANIDGVYSVVDTELIEGKRILIIDDIITTGSTLSECSSMLLQAGAEKIVCAALARGE